jgi:hypothetical protein
VEHRRSSRLVALTAQSGRQRVITWTWGLLANCRARVVIRDMPASQSLVR